MEDNSTHKKRRTGKLVRFLFSCSRPYFTSIDVGQLLLKNGVSIVFANMKFSILPKNTLAALPIESPSLFKTIEKTFLAKTISIKCYVELEEHFLPLPKHFAKMISPLSPVEELFPTAKTIGFDWYPLFTKYILPYFHSPPEMASKLHRDNSYNLLGLELLHQHMCCFEMFQNHFYFNKFAVRCNVSNLLNMKNKWNSCKEFGRIVVKRDGKNLQLLSTQLCNDKEIVLYAMASHNFSTAKQKANFFTSLPAVMRGDKEIAMIAVTADGQLFDFVSSELKEDKDIVLTALETAPHLFITASPLVKTDRECVLKAVSKDGVLLKFVCTSLKDDEEVVKRAVLQNAKAREYMGSSIRQDKRAMINLLSQCPELTLEPIYDCLLQDTEFMQVYRDTAFELMTRNSALK